MEQDVVERLFTLAIPLLFIFGGLWCGVVAIRGRTGKGEHPRKGTMSETAFKNFRKNEIVIGLIVSIGMIAFGGWLFYCWMFGPVER